MRLDKTKMGKLIYICLTEGKNKYTYMTFEALAKIIGNIPKKYQQKVIAIDGGGGAGKTTFATQLQKSLPNSFIVKIDDFYKPPQLRSDNFPKNQVNPNFDWDRFNKQVITAIKKGKPVSYQLYDFKSGDLSGEILKAGTDVTLIVEGVWSMQENLSSFYDYRIWLEASKHTRLTRGVQRDGEDMRKEWEKHFIPMDDYYRETEKPQLKAELLIDSDNSDFEKNTIITL